MNPIDWQLVLDAHDAHALADFWVAALHYELEDHSAMIEQLLQSGVARDSDTVRHNGVLSWNGLAALRGGGRRMLIAEVPETKVVKNRMHIDLNVGPDNRDAEVDRLVGLGASRVVEVNERGSHHWVLADPEGNEFCVQ